MKRGVLEVADIIAFNKADGDRAAATSADAASLRASLSISRPNRVPPVLVLSALADSGVADLFAELNRFYAAARGDGSLEGRRGEQRLIWFESAFEEAVHELFTRRPDLALARQAAANRVASGATSASEAARGLLADLLPPTAR